MTNRIGDRPRFPLTNQRFDKGDAENIARYYEEIISRFTGSIYGQAWGCVSSPGFSVATIPIMGSPTQYHLQFSRCVLLSSVPENGNPQATNIDQGPWQATLAVYDPVKEGQDVQSLILNSFATAQSRPWVLFRRKEKPTALGNKAYWDTSTNTERTGAANLQQTEYVEFLLSLSYSLSDTEAGWYRMAYIDSWTGTGASATPVIVPIHWMDSQYYDDALPPVQGTAVASALAFPGFSGAIGTKGFSPLTEMPELTKLVHWLAGKLGEHYSTVGTLQVTEANSATYRLKPGAFVAQYGDAPGGWLSSPERGLVELNNDLAEAEQDIVDLNNVDVSLAQSISVFMARYMRTTRLLHTLYVTPVKGATDNWPDYTFDVRVTASQEPDSFAPRLGGWEDASADIRYRIVADAYGSSEGFRQFGIELGPTLLSPPVRTYEVSNVGVVPYNEAVATEDYTEGFRSLALRTGYTKVGTGDVPVPPVILSGSTTLILRSEVTQSSDNFGLIRPFAVHIYGRNV